MALVRISFRLKDVFALLIEIVFMIVGGLFIFPLVFVFGFVYTILKHVFYKRDYSTSKHFIPILRSFTLASDGLANAGGGEMLNCTQSKTRSQH